MPVGFRKREKYNKGPSRRTQNAVPGARNNVQPGTPITALSATFSGDTAVITFDQPVILNSIPQYTAGASPGELPSSATMDSTNTILTLSYPSTPTGSLTIPFQDPGIRNSSAGYVLPQLIAIVAEPEVVKKPPKEKHS